jgi:antitoxin component of MazEF toxin-antitoxin module
MKRKVVKQGTSTLTISLPSKWANKFSLQSGDEVYVEDKDNSLLIYSNKSRLADMKVVNAKELDFLVDTVVHELYLNGHDEIKVVCDDKSKINIFKEKFSHLSGFEIIEQGTNFFTLRDIVGTTDKEFDTLYRKCFLLFKTSLEEDLSFLSQNDFGNLSYDVGEDTFLNICFRHLNKKGYKEFTKTQTISSVVKLLKDLREERDSMIKFIVQNQISFQDNFLIIYRNLHTLFGLCYDFSFKLNNDTAKKIFLLYGSNKNLISEEFNCTDPRYLKLVFYLNSLNDKIVQIQKVQLAFL